MSDPRLDPEAIKAAIKAGRESGEGWGMSTGPTSEYVVAMRIVKAIAEAPEPQKEVDECNGYSMAKTWWKAARALVGGNK